MGASCPPDNAPSAVTGEVGAGFMSVASVFINKAIFHVYDFKFPYTLVFGQTLFTLVLLTAMRSLHIIRMAPFQLSVLHRVGVAFPLLSASSASWSGAPGRVGTVMLSCSLGCATGPALCPRCSKPSHVSRGTERRAGLAMWKVSPGPSCKCPPKLVVLSCGSCLPWRMVQVSLLSFAFLLKLLLDMSALSRVNIPMYGVLKSATTPFVLLLDYVLRDKRASMRVQLSVYMTALGGFVAGLGDLTFDMAGYILALSSAMATAAYVVIVGKLGEELQLDSFTLLLYNNCWSLPFSFLLVVANGEMGALYRVTHPTDVVFVLYFLASCTSAFILNLATYLCTLVNDSLTTSIVGEQPILHAGLSMLSETGRPAF